MLSFWKSVIIFIAIFAYVVEAAKQATPKKVVEGVKVEAVEGLKVSKYGKGRSSLSIGIYVSYLEPVAGKGRISHRVDRRIQVNDTELVEALDFKKLDKKKVTYDDLRYAVLNRTTLSSLLETFSNDAFKGTIAEDSSYAQVNRGGFLLDSPASVNSTETVMYTPNPSHWKTKDTLASAVLPAYLLIGFATAALYLGRGKFLNPGQSLFKLSNVSRFILKFVYIRLAYDVIYLGYLFLFINFKFFYTSGVVYFFFLFADEVINLFTFYFVISIFAQGYMTLNQDKKILFKPTTIILSVLYFIAVTIVDMVYKSRGRNSPFSVSGNMRSVALATVAPTAFIAPVIVLSKLTILFGGSYLAYTTHKTSAKKDSRFLISALVIFFAYYGCSFITFPVFHSGQEFAGYLRTKFLSVSQSIYTRRAEVPQLIQLAVAAWLIYFWRDKSYDKVATEDVENSYELH